MFAEKTFHDTASAVTRAHSAPTVPNAIVEATLDGQFLWKKVNPNVGLYSASERRSLIDRDVRVSPDPAYSEWCVENFRQALSSGRTTIHDVDAIIRHQDGNDLRVFYRRVLVPLATSRKTPQLLAASSAISIRPPEKVA
jgi:hypothetical protein